MTVDRLPDFFAAERIVTAAQARIEALRGHPDVQLILATAVTADAATLRHLHRRWMAHNQIMRTVHTRLWHAFVKAAGDRPARDVSALGEDTRRLMDEHPTSQWGASFATGDAVMAVHMASYVDAAELASVYTSPWNDVFKEQQ